MTKTIFSLTQSTFLSSRLSAGLLCLFIGMGLIYAVGLSDIAAAHNAAHDTRHAIGFPCH